MTIPAHGGSVRVRPKAQKVRVRPTGVFAQPLTRISPVGNGQQQAARAVRRAADQLPAEHQLPRFPTLRRYSPQQRTAIENRTVQAVRGIAKQRGVPGSQATDRLYSQGDTQTRQTLRLYGRAVREQRDVAHSNALHTLVTAPVNPDLNALTEGERQEWRSTGTLRSPVSQEGQLLVRRQQTQAYLRQQTRGLTSTRDRASLFRALTKTPRSQLKAATQPHGVGAVTAPLASFILSPNRNAFVAAWPGVKRLTGPVVHDLFSLPRNAVVSGYVVGKALEKAARGHPGELKALGKSFKNTDPLALAVQGRWREAEIAASEHPLNTTLELGGARAPLRGVGRLLRVGTKREAAVLPGAAIEQAREYTPNPIGKRVQIATENARIRKADRLRSEADAADKRGDPTEADAKRMQASRVDPRIVSEGYVQHRADVRESMGQPLRRRGRTNTMKEMKPTYVRPREGGHLQRLSVEGSIPVRRVGPDGEFDHLHGQISVKHMREDIVAKLKRLKAEHDAQTKDGKYVMPASQRRLNRRTQAHLEALSQKSDAQLLNVAHRGLDAAAITNRLERDVIAREMLDPQEARIARDKTYAVEHMGAKVGRAEGRTHEQLLDSGGRPLHPDVIETHMRAHGVDPESIAFVTQRPGGTVGAYNMRWSGAKGASTRTRTGLATIRGLVDTHPRNLTANAVRLQQLVAANTNWEHGLGEVAQRTKGTIDRYDSKGRADSAAREIEARTGMKQRAVRMIPWAGRESQLQHLLDHADAEGFVGRSHPVSQAIEDAVKESATGSGPWALVPDAWARRIEEHSQVYRSVHPALRAINGMFRHTVLPLSLSWLTGNVAEAALRTAIKSPRVLHNLVTYKRVLGTLKKIDPEEAAQVQDLIGVGHFGSMEQSSVFTSAAQFSNSRFRPVAEAFHRLRTAPGPGTLADAYRAYTHFVFEHVNNQLERPFREAMAGHHIRMALMDSSRAIRNSHQAVLDAAHGLRETNAQVRLADDVRRGYGQYEAWSPAVRKLALMYTPFAPWAINAVRFLFTVLPKDHPALTAAIAAADSLTEDYRKQHGLDEWTKGAVPGFLLGSIPTASGGHLRAARYTPFGAFSDPTATISDQILPQFSGVLDAFNGRDWTGKDLKNSDGTPFTTDQRLSFAAGQLAQSLIPGINILSRAVQAPGSNPASKLLYVENPARVVKKKQPTAKTEVDKILERHGLSTGTSQSAEDILAKHGVATSSGQTAEDILSKYGVK